MQRAVLTLAGAPAALPDARQWARLTQLHTALCRMRLAAVALKQPDRRPLGTPKHAPMPVSAIFVREETLPVAGSEPLCWLLLTTLPRSSFADACRCIY